VTWKDATRPQTASSEDVREINRRIVLNLIRTRQPVSRADLARLSGMQRSTISIIVEQLIEERWVLEGATGRLPRGRRPTFLLLNNDRVIIAVDVRPIQTTVAVADVNGEFSSQQVMETPADAERATRAIVRQVQTLMRACRTKKIEGVGVTLPGRYDHRRQRLAFAPNLRWTDWDIGPQLAEATGLEVALENAANACVLAAAWFGQAEGARDLVVITVSEGLGTGVMVNGQLMRGVGGMAGEFGHVPIDPDGPICACGSRGCWEVFASNSAALRYYAGRRAPDPALTFAGLLARADRGDRKAGESVDRMAHFLGRGMRMLMAGLAPDRIIVSGDLTRSWTRVVPILEAEIRQQSLPNGRIPPVMAADEDGAARLRGAVALVLQRHFGNPPLVPGLDR
jgi:predicted NBD/HSP70 family sugar kinase